MAARDAQAALAMHVELLTTATGDMSSWAVSLSSQRYYQTLIKRVCSLESSSSSAWACE